MNTLSQGFNECAFEHVVPVGLQLIEDLLEVIDVPWLREPERVDASRKIHSVCGLNGGMFWPVTSIEKCKDLCAALFAKQVDDHAYLRWRRGRVQRLTR